MSFFRRSIMGARATVQAVAEEALSSGVDVDDERDTTMDVATTVAIDTDSHAHISGSIVAEGSSPLNVLEAEDRRAGLQVAASSLDTQDASGTSGATQQGTGTSGTGEANMQLIAEGTSDKRSPSRSQQGGGLEDGAAASSAQTVDKATEDPSSWDGEDEGDEGTKPMVQCRFCLGEEPEGSDSVVAPCDCGGSAKYVHRACLRRWQQIKDTAACEVCKCDWRVPLGPFDREMWIRRVETNSNYRRVQPGTISSSVESHLRGLMRPGTLILQTPEFASESEISLPRLLSGPPALRAWFALLASTNTHWQKGVFLIIHRGEGEGSDGSDLLVAVNITRPVGMPSETTHAAARRLRRASGDFGDEADRVAARAAAEIDARDDPTAGQEALYVVTGGDPAVNGEYVAGYIPSYVGTQVYRKRGSTVFMLRWQRQHWCIRDMGPDLDAFDDMVAQSFCAIENNDDTPPTSRSWGAVKATRPCMVYQSDDIPAGVSPQEYLEQDFDVAVSDGAPEEDEDQGHDSGASSPQSTGGSQDGGSPRRSVGSVVFPVLRGGPCHRSQPLCLFGLTPPSGPAETPTATDDLPPAFDLDTPMAEDVSGSSTVVENDARAPVATNQPQDRGCPEVRGDVEDIPLTSDIAGKRLMLAQPEVAEGAVRNFHDAGWDVNGVVVEGCAVWSSDQLLSEIQTGSWGLCEATWEDIPFSFEATGLGNLNLWRDAWDRRHPLRI